MLTGFLFVFFSFFSFFFFFWAAPPKIVLSIYPQKKSLTAPLVRIVVISFQNIA